MSFETISVVGLGYIGLPTAAMFASCKKKVIGVDINKHAIDTINRGEIHIIEPNLDVIVHSAVNEGYLKATLTPEPADAFLIAVPTPFKDSVSNVPEPDLKYIHSAVKSIAPILKKGDLVILESTSPVGTTEKMAAWLAEIRPDLSFPQHADESADINVAHCPERVLPGHVVKELVENDRVIGGMSVKCSEKAIELYKTFVKGDCIVTNARTAEMAKLTENSCRDVQIAFANELSMICDKLDINIWELISLANRHPRINILQPGPGVGGHCIAVDPWFIISKTPNESELIQTARLRNLKKEKWVVNKIYEKIQSTGKDLSNCKITLWGVSFKPNIDDIRESPALNIANELTKKIKNLTVVEPNLKELKGFKLIQTDEALKSSDLNVVLVKHNEFLDVKFNITKTLDVVGII